ncbi:MAG: GNAT family N-acetyltransferase [Promethearchaeota archaeon]
MIPMIRRFNEEDIQDIQKFDKDFKLVLTECRDKGWIYVAVINQAIVGYFALFKGQESAYFDQNIINWAEIRELHVNPLYQRKGIGTKLVEYASNLADKEGFSRIYVTTDDFNQIARKIYIKCGFQELNRIVRYRFILKNSDDL